MSSANRVQYRDDRLRGLSEAPARFAALAFLIVATLWLSFMAAGDGALRADVSITRSIQDNSSLVTDAVTEFGNAFGSAKVGVPLGIAFALLLFRRGYSQGGVFLLAATFMRAANYGLKSIFDSQRPTADLVQVESSRDSNGFPSGHAQGATLLCGAILIAVWPLLNFRQRIVACFAAFAVVVATAFARVHVGAHWPTDVLGGVLWGVILLILVALLIRNVRTITSN